MVAKYYVAIRPQTDENHAVHKEGCPFLPDYEKRVYLGKFNSFKDAVREGHRYFARTNRCLFCLKEHKPERMETVFSETDNTLNVPIRSQISQTIGGVLFYFLN